MSVAAMEVEIVNQLEDLPRFASRLERQQYKPVDPSELIFTGSGDSYATALYAQEVSGGAALASDPYELFLKLDRARGKHVILISISGRTKANIELARKLKRVARKRIAVTANADSPLARICDEKIVLRYRTAGTLTSGTVSFTASLLAMAHILEIPPGRTGLHASMGRAVRWARSLRVPSRGSFYLIGSGVNRALAEYGACKVHEVLGAKADARVPEQFGHAQLFSIDRRKDTIVCIPANSKDKTTKVAETLQQDGFRVHTIPGHGPNIVTRSIEVSLHLQHLALSLARKRRMKECAFLTDRSRLRVSNRLIY